jgi:hypothetical protein
LRLIDAIPLDGSGRTKNSDIPLKGNPGALRRLRIDANQCTQSKSVIVIYGSSWQPESVTAFTASSSLLGRAQSGIQVFF